MNFDTLQALDKLQVSIDDRLYEGQRGVSEWRDYDVLICERKDEAVRHWRMLPTENVHAFQRKEPHRRYVATRYASALAWLFEALKAIHENESEHHTHHDFYAELADTANLYIDENTAGVTATRLLETVLNKVRSIYR